MSARSVFRVFAPMFALALALAPSIAFAADQKGKPGVAKEIEVVTPSADAYLQYHGRLVLQVSKSLSEEYRWGGTSCGSKTLSAENVMALSDAVTSGLSVEPIFQAGQGSIKCLVGFSLG